MTDYRIADVREIFAVFLQRFGLFSRKRKESGDFREHFHENLNLWTIFAKMKLGIFFSTVIRIQNNYSGSGTALAQKSGSVTLATFDL
jgi:hypothetical protein